MTSLKNITKRLKIKTPFGTSDNNEEFKDELLKVEKYVKTMLGDDMLMVELTVNQIAAVLEEAYITWNTIVLDYAGSNIDYSKLENNLVPFRCLNTVVKAWIAKYTLATCKIVLGHIRSKVLPKEMEFGVGQLISTGTSEQQALVEQIKELIRSKSSAKLV